MNRVCISKYLNNRYLFTNFQLSFSVKISIIWDITPRFSEKVNRSRQIATIACCLLHSEFLFSLLFDPEDSGDVILCNTH
jgi:hypothetical protein